MAAVQETELCVGTMKGLLRFRSRDRVSWRLERLDFPGSPVHTTAYDPRTQTLFAAVNDAFFGQSLRRSADGGATWQAAGDIAYGADDPEKVSRIWSLLVAPAPTPRGVVFAGVEASGLFRSDDGGDSFREVASLREHPTHDLWGPGAGGKCLHTLAIDPFDRARMYVAASAGGLYRSDDDGATWAPKNSGLRAEFLPEDQQFPIAGQCVHRVALSASGRGRMWLQNHGGVYRSDDAGDSWANVSEDLPDDFGFPVVAHPRRPDTAFVVPLSRQGRWAPEQRLAVYRTDDAGGTWRPLRAGLPGGVYVNVLRTAMAADAADPLGLYFGTTSGAVFASADEGETWHTVAEHLPRVLSVAADAPQT